MYPAIMHKLRVPIKLDSMILHNRDMYINIENRRDEFG